MIEPEILKRKEAILDIARRYGATDVRIFGSRSRGSGGPKSDLDVLIKLQPGGTYLDIIAIKQDMEELLGLTVDVLTEAAISPFFRKGILEEAIPL